MSAGTQINKPQTIIMGCNPTTGNNQDLKIPSHYNRELSVSYWRPYQKLVGLYHAEDVLPWMHIVVGGVIVDCGQCGGCPCGDE